MDDKGKIDAAIDAHVKWFARLRMAIDGQASEFKPEQVKVDNACEFGKWLYGGFPPGLKSGPVYATIKGLHASFHAEASRILTLGLAGKKAEALQAMDPSGSFKKSSMTLIAQLNQLKRQV